MVALCRAIVEVDDGVFPQNENIEGKEAGMFFSAQFQTKPNLLKHYGCPDTNIVGSECSSKYVFLTISNISQENACVGGIIKKRLQHRCFLVNLQNL